MADVHKQIRNLLATARAHADTPEGQSAQNLANKKLDKLGLTEADVMEKKVVVLEKEREVWEVSLLTSISGLFKVLVRQNIVAKQDVDEIYITGAENEVDRALVEYHAARHGVLKATEIYESRLNHTLPIVHAKNVPRALSVFKNYATIALSSRLEDLAEDIEEEEPEPVEMPEEKPDFTPADLDQVPIDQLLDQVEEEEALVIFEFDAYRHLDPTLEGYAIGCGITLHLEGMRLEQGAEFRKERMLASTG